MGTNDSKACRSQVKYVGEGVYVKPIGDEMRKKVYYDEILWIKAENTHCVINLIKGKPIHVAHNIGYVDSELSPFGIVRINRSEMVNIRYVRRYVNSALYLEYEESGCIHTVTESYRKKVFSLFKEL
jgi:DNA-binding LytR/AlgR family response regulator